MTNLRANAGKPLESFSMTAHRPALSIVSAAYNEEPVLPLFHTALLKVLEPLRPKYPFEIVFVDDGSSDGTWKVLEGLAANFPCTRAIRLAKNVGQPGALSAGLEHAQGDLVISLDADLQHPPEIIPELLRLWHEKKTPVVQTIRIEDSSQTLFKRLTSRWFASLISRITGLRIPAGAADYRLMERSAVEALKGLNDHPRMMRAAVASLHLPTTFKEYHAKKRAAGISKYSLRSLAALACRSLWTYGDLAGLLFKCCAVAAAISTMAGLILLAIQASQGNPTLGGAAVTILCTLFALFSSGLSVLSSYLKALTERLPSPPRYSVKERTNAETSLHLHAEEGSKPTSARQVA
jgi:dolichol-phosphate mannosyltransferase